MEEKQTPVSLGAYTDIINGIEDPVYRETVRKSYEAKLFKLNEFGQKVKELAEQFDLENMTDPEDFRQFVKTTIEIGTKRFDKSDERSRFAGGNYIDADNNFLKILPDIENEDIWRVRKELYQDRYLGLGVFVYRHVGEIQGFLDGGKNSSFRKEGTHQYARDDFRDREETILGAWEVGGKFIQDFLKAKSAAKPWSWSDEEWKCPNTRNLLIDNGLIAE